MDDEGLEPEEGGPLAAFAGEETTAIGEGRVSACSPTGAELADVSSWTSMLGMFSSSSAPPSCPSPSESCQWGSQSHYSSAGSNSDAEAEVWVGATSSPNSTSTSPREPSTVVAV